MSIHGSLAGQSWNLFPNYVTNNRSGTSSPSHSPRPPSPRGLSSNSNSPSSSKDDVMKLPAKDMHIFGICPTQDEFILVICEICGKRIKLEAFESHSVLRHGSQRQKDARRAMLNDKASAVDLIRENLFNSLKSTTSSNNSSRRSSVSPSMSSKTPVKSQEPEEQLTQEVDKNFPKMEVVEDDEEEPDSTSSNTNNVISIPDNEPLPAGMSNDLMAMVENTESGSLVLPPPPPPTSSVILNPTSAHHPCSSSSSNNSVILPKTSGSSLLLNNNETAVKPSPSKKARSDRRQNSRDREYHPDKHCGVWDSEGKKHCTRALTCKSHSVLLKRKIPGRSKSFDELVVEHKAVKEAAALAAKAASTTPSTPTTIETIPNGVISRTTSAPSYTQQIPTTSQTTIQQPQQPPPPQEENLFYTTDHPKPLAVCTFGGRRMAGTLLTSRNDFYTRKALRIALSSQTYQRINGGERLRIIKQQGRSGGSPAMAPRPSPPPQLLQQAASPNPNGGGFLINYNLHHPALNHHSPSLVKIQQPQQHQQQTPVAQQQQRLSTGLKLTTLQPNIVIQDTFKTADFSGIQFEFGK